MENKVLKFAPIIIYICYGYLLCWQIYYINEEIFTRGGSRDSGRSFFGYMPAIVLLLYGVLLYGNVVRRQRRILIFNSFFAASLLYIYETFYSLLIAVLLSLFGLVIAFFELTNKVE